MGEELVLSILAGAKIEKDDLIKVAKSNPFRVFVLSFFPLDVLDEIWD